MESRPDATAEPAVLSAGTDPTHIPGLDDVAAEEPAAPAEPGERPAGSAPGADHGAGGPEDEDTGAEDADNAGEDLGEDAEDSGGEEEPPEGPSFEVSDRRGSIVADGRGVVLRLDDTEARFAWGEIGAVEIGSSLFGRRFEICVCTTDHRRFDAEIEAASRRQAGEWAGDLDAVLDTWFEDSAT